MSLFPYLPPLVSIYLLLTSAVAGSYLKSKVSQFVEGKDELEKHQEVIQNVALDWSARLNFMNSMFAALISMFSIFYNSNGSWVFWVALGSLLLIFSYFGWWVHGLDIDELPSLITRRFVRVKYSFICRSVLVVVNIALLVTIYLSRHSSASSAPTP